MQGITIEALVTDAARARTGTVEGLRFCADVSCDVAYFHPERGERIVRSEVRVRIGQKEVAPSRPVCYCFEHTEEEIEADVLATGSSQIAAEITEKCHAGLQRCEQTNPQGSCCLGNVRQVVKAAQARPTGATAASGRVDVSAAPGDCCSSADAGVPELNDRSTSRGGGLATTGALVAAVLSSACCWLPPLLVTLGVSAVGVAGLVESYRPYLLGVTTLFLGGGFYLVYGRRRACEPDGTCAAPDPRRDRLQKISLWVATLLVLGFALFPEYVGYLLGDGDSSSGVAMPDDHESRAFRVDGMTCEACAVTLREALMDVSGVAWAEVSFETQSARVFSSGDNASVDDETLLEVIRLAGYEGQPVPVATSVDIEVTGMTCAGCAAGLQDRLREIPGVDSATVVFESSRASIALDDPAALDAVLSAIAEEGFDTVVLSKRAPSD